MRITNSMMRSDSLWNINRNEIMMNKYQTQLSSGKKIQKPSEDPIVAIRALKFRANVKEIAQYKTNAEDATSWLSTTEQSLDNSVSLLKRARDLCVQGASDVFTTNERESIVTELEQLKTQLLSEANVNYAGRYIYSGYKTNKPVVFVEDQTGVNFDITETFANDQVEKIQKAVETGAPGSGQYQISDAYRIRLGYDDITDITAAIAAGIGTLTINEMNSGDDDAYEPAQGSVNFLKDTGELIFNYDNVRGEDDLGNPVDPIPASFNIEYGKNNFEKGDLSPEHFFNCTNTTAVPPITYTIPDDKMIYQISYNQEIIVNTLAKDVFTTDMIRDLEEIINAVKGITDDGSDFEGLKEDLLGDIFSKMLTKIDAHNNKLIREEAVIGSKINRLELTINRLEDDKINFTELMSLNEDVDMTEAVLDLKAHEIVYNASLTSSSMLMQKSLIDFIR